MQHQLLQCCTESATEFRSVKAYGKVIQFYQSYSQQLWEVCNVTLIGVSAVFQSMEKKLPNARFADDVTIIAHDLEELGLGLEKPLSSKHVAWS